MDAHSVPNRSPGLRPTPLASRGCSGSRPLQVPSTLAAARLIGCLIFSLADVLPYAVGVRETMLSHIPPSTRPQEAGLSTPPPTGPRYLTSERQKEARRQRFEGVNGLKSLDARLEAVLHSGAIKLVHADALRDETLVAKLMRRQDLEAFEQSSGRRILSDDWQTLEIWVAPT